MRLNFHTNLDEAKEDVAALGPKVWSKDGLPIPRKGERVRFTFVRDGVKHYDLEVVGIDYLFDAALPLVNIELHIPSHYGSMSIAEWTAWFRRHRTGRER